MTHTCSRACRIRPAVVEALALSRHAAPLGNVGQSRSRGICPVCLEGDRQSGCDQYVRRRRSRSETVACLIHRVCLRFSRMKCFTRYDSRFEYRDGLAELICSGCLAPVACTAGTLFEVRCTDLLIGTMEATDDAEKGWGGLTPWGDSENSGKPEVTFFHVSRYRAGAGV